MSILVLLMVAVFFGLVGFCYGLRQGCVDAERFLKPQVEHFSTLAAERQDEIQSLKDNYTPINGKHRMEKNVLTREN